jgi:hypothetical protein
MKLFAIVAFVFIFIRTGFWLLDKWIATIDPHNDSEMYRNEGKRGK